MKLKILTYNIQHCLNYMENKIDFDFIGKTIKKIDADVVGLNEVRGNGKDPEYTEQMDILAPIAGYKYFKFGRAITLDEGLYGNGFMSRIPVENISVIPISDPEIKNPDTWYEERCIIKAKLTNGLTVLVSHFGCSPEEQEKAVRIVMENIEKEKCVLMGDFNVEPEDKILLPIRNVMKDTADLFKENLMSWPSDKPEMKIDYIFVSKDIKVVSSDIPEIIASDHRPHIAEIEFQEKMRR